MRTVDRACYNYVCTEPARSQATMSRTGHCITHFCIKCACFFPIICWLIRFVRCQEACTFKTLESYFYLKLWVGPSGNASATIEKPHVFFFFDSDFSCARPRGEQKNSKEPRIKHSFSRCPFIGLTGIPFFLRLLMLVVSITVRREKKNSLEKQTSLPYARFHEKCHSPLAF